MILIAESKTMAPEAPVASADYLCHQPRLNAGADRIMATLGSLSDADLAKATGLTPGLLASLRSMIFEFPDKSPGLKAIEAFTGVVFKQLHPGRYDSAAKQRLDTEVRIISSVYGLLRPSDIVKTYRLDFKSRPAPGAPNMMSHWKSQVTDLLIADLDESGCDEIIDLMPADAARCVDWKRVEKRARVWRVDFKVVTPEGTLRTPDAGRLKRLRGQLLDLAVARGAMTAAELRDLEGPDFAPACLYGSTATQSPEGVIAFVTA